LEGFQAGEQHLLQGSRVLAGASCTPFQTERFEPAFPAEHLFEGEELEVRAASPVAGDKGLNQLSKKYRGNLRDITARVLQQERI
jgi:hypothetical protein